MNHSHHRLNHDYFLVPPGKKVKLQDYDPGYTSGFRSKDAAKEALLEDVSALAFAQELLWASKDRAILIILQALDAAGKDGAIKHVMSGVNPQGCSVHSFRAPTEEERDHDFLWRPHRFLPGRGRIAIFNRSYYEEVLIVRVHPEFLDTQWIPQHVRQRGLEAIWKQRYDDINRFEETLVNNGTVIIKFFLHISKKEQKKRFLARLNNPDKQWKFEAADIRERRHWDEYIAAYNDMLSATSTKWAPWYIIPGNKKWFSRACVADVVTARIEELDLRYPAVSQEQLQQLDAARDELESAAN